MMWTDAAHKPSSQKIPVRELRASDKTDIVELAVVMQTGKCPFIVEFFGCLIRDVSVCMCGWGSEM